MASDVPIAKPSLNAETFPSNIKDELLRPQNGQNTAGDGSLHARLTGNPFFTAVSPRFIFHLNISNI